METGGLAALTLDSHKAIVVEPHQRWSATATEPVVALLVEGSFEVWAVAVTKEIVVVPMTKLRTSAMMTPFISSGTSLAPRKKILHQSQSGCT